MNVPRIFISIKNNQKLRYVVMALALYLFFLIYSLPASFVLSFVSLPKNIMLSSVSGSAWSGQARELNYSAVNLGVLKWQINPLYLLTGKLVADVSLSNRGQYFNSEISLGLSGNIELEDTRFRVDIASLQPLTYGMPFTYAGHVTGDFPAAFIETNHYLQLTGQLVLNDLKLTSPQQQLFGDINLEFTADKNGGSSARITDGGGPLSISGMLRLDKSAGLYLSAKLSARETGSQLDQMLSLFGKKDQAGRVQVNTQLRL